jgi:tRNA (guanine-N7-)-methyltransferase
MSSAFPLRRIQSFVRRDGRMTDAQREVLTSLWPQYGLNIQDGMLDAAKVFARDTAVILEIGFGSGQSLLQVAKANPECNFIGIETYQPGIGSLLLGMQIQEISNIRIYYADAVEVLHACIAPASLDGLQIFFPDPWPKRRHHKRRLIQPEFVEMVIKKLKQDGIFHLATDWEHYALQMMRVLSAIPELINVAGPQQFAVRSQQRPIVTKFEQRGHHSGRPIWELQFRLA